MASFLIAEFRRWRISLTQRRSARSGTNSKNSWLPLPRCRWERWGAIVQNNH
ncbi:hypothetical protein H6G52_11180 [Limnothrix sp. FACHB-881]|uniref:hypothetical protein n=1 Tax=Limnothrix sp. FACHB-881 TaxID=2692819 RepID=UPI0016850149|nr:hypothetical protein [Limnothrix sp. FACHB-881]MBD2635921.1 hypothetical protein [Limnothrix sp. FACHB-881]